jgi:hypothetical protein
LDATATRHQAGGFGIKNSTEFGVKLEAQNKWVTPYVRGAYDINLEQAGAGVGVYRTFALPFVFFSIYTSTIYNIRVLFLCRFYTYITFHSNKSCLFLGIFLNIKN